MRRFCKSLTEHPMEIINLKMKKRKLLTNEQGNMFVNIFIFVNINLKINMPKLKNIKLSKYVS